MRQPMIQAEASHSRRVKKKHFLSSQYRTTFPWWVRRTSLHLLKICRCRTWFQADRVFRGPQIIISRATLNAVPGPKGVLEPVQYGTIYMSVPTANLDAVR